MSEINLNLPAKSEPKKTIREHTDELLCALKTLCDFDYIKDDKIIKLCELACEYHDYGKVNSDFQKRIKTNKKFDETKEIPHNILSAAFVNKADFDSPEDYAVVLNAVLNHHHYSDNIKIIEEDRDDIYVKLKEFNLKKINSRDVRTLKNIREKAIAVLVQGILYKCDYSASGGIESEYKNDFLINNLYSLFEEWKEKNPNIKLNEMQEFCCENKDENLIVTAPTGMGKTEASLFWIGDNKGFYILPLRTAINSIYLRICGNILKGEDTQKKVALLHSDSMSIVLKNQMVSEIEVYDYINLSRRFSLPITVCTPDQIFNFIFKYRGYELKLATLSYSKIIIDEIQAYNAELLSYIIYGIHEIIKMGGKIAIFTATLPPFILDLLDIPYEKSPFKLADFSGTQKQVRHNVKVIDTEIDEGFIYQKFIENKNNESNKILVVCNTVKNAQKMYNDLVSRVGEENVRLLHAKFTKNDRAIKEKDILEDGKSEANKSIIWVATQIVEASLDIDFDMIFTELSELSGFFQRLGRCNRKGLKPTEKYNCYVFLKINANLLISKYNSNRGFIDKDIYELSKKELLNIDGILTESMKKNMLETAFTLDNLKNSVFIKEYREKYKYVSQLFVDDYDAQEIDKRFRRISSKTVIPHDVYSDNKLLIEQAVEDLNTTQVVNVKQKAKELIEGFCVSVSSYEVGRDDVVFSIKLNKFINVEVVKCLYDEKLGFRKIQSVKSQKADDDIGLFM